MDEGTLNEWLVKPGDTVTRGQVVAVVETTKAAVEVECWHEGTVQELLVPIGETVQVGTALATLLAPGETAATARTREADRPPPKQPAARPAATDGQEGSCGRGSQAQRRITAVGSLRPRAASPHRWVSTSTP